MILDQCLANSWNASKNKNTKITFDEYPVIAEKYKSGLTLSEIGKEYGVSRERIRQILSLFGLTRVDGGSSTRSILKCQEVSQKNKSKQEKKEKKIFSVYGCSVEFLEQMRGDGDYKKSPLQKYRRQKQNARTRGIEFNLTLHEWWDLWSESGHWDDMGLGKGKYHMCRICDAGSYEVGNVEIKPHEENSREARLMDKVYQRKSAKIFYVEFRGNKYNINELATIHNIKPTTLKARIRKGMSAEDAITTPVKLWRRYG